VSAEGRGASRPRDLRALRRNLGDAVTAAVARLDGDRIRRLGRAGGVAIVVLGGLGVAFAAGAPLGLFDLDGEGNLPAAFSGLLLLVAAVLALALADRAASVGVSPRALWAMALVFGWMAVDEVFTVHEHLDEVTGVDWQLIYVPLLVVAAWGWARIWRSLRGRRLAWTPWLGGLLAWGLAQALELGTFGGIVRQGSIDTADEYDDAVGTVAYELEAIPEELLEMAGSLLWALGLLIVLRRVAQPRGARA